MGLNVKADVIENRLYFKLSGNFAKEEIEKLYTEDTFLVADLTPGYDVIADFSECDIGKIKKAAVNNGINLEGKMKWKMKSL